jgi:hypothetical protein
MDIVDSRIRCRMVIDARLVRLLVMYVTAVVMVVLSTNTVGNHVSRSNIFTSAFTATKTPIYHHNQHIIHPNHCIRINPTKTTTLNALPQSMSITARCRTRSQRPVRTDLTSRLIQQNSLLKQHQQGIKFFSSTALENSAIPIVASSTSFVGVAFVSAISAGIFSGGLHAIAGTCIAINVHYIFPRITFLISMHLTTFTYDFEPYIQVQTTSLLFFQGVLDRDGIEQFVLVRYGGSDMVYQQLS